MEQEEARTSKSKEAGLVNLRDQILLAESGPLYFLKNGGYDIVRVLLTGPDGPRYWLEAEQMFKEGLFYRGVPGDGPFISFQVTEKGKEVREHLRNPGAVPTQEMGL